MSLMFVTILVCFSTASIAEPILIFGNHEKPPKNYLINNQAEGILIEFMQYVDQDLDQSFEYRLFPWNRAYNNAISGQGGIIGLSKTSKRLEIFDYSDVMYYEDLMLVVMAGNEFTFNSIADLKGKTVGFQRGASFDDEFEHGKGTVFLAAEDDGIKQRIIKLINNRIDVAIIGPGVDGFNIAIQQYAELLKNKDKFVVLPVPFRRDPNYLGFAKSMQMQDFLVEFNRILKQGQDDGSFDGILKKYTP